MKKLRSYILLFVLLSTSVFSATYYVSISGSAANPGTIAQPWSLVHAVATATAGDLVWIKAGNYGNLNLVFNNSGTALNKIQFIGYQNSVGDLDSTDLPLTVNSYTNSNYSTIYPTITGASRASGIAMAIYGRVHITIKNLHITNYKSGIDVYGNNTKHIKLSNIIASQFGDPAVYYDGSAIGLSLADSCTLDNAFVLNSCAAAIGIGGYHLYVRHCKAFCNEDFLYSNTDYYYAMSREDNLVEYCYAENLVPNSAHGGHQFFMGLGIFYKATIPEYTQNNIYRHCKAVNAYLAIEARNIGTRNNLFEDIQVKNTSSGFFTYGIFIQGANDNTFNRIEIDVTAPPSRGSVITFAGMDTTAVNHYTPGVSLPQTKNAGRRNKITNSLFKHNREFAIYLLDWHGAPYCPADSNEFINCTFVNTDQTFNQRYLILAGRKNRGNILKNCIISGYDHFSTSPTFSSTIGFKFENCLFNNNGFNTSTVSVTGATITNCINSNPLFVNPATNDFHLQSTSPCVNAGLNTGLTTDFDKNPRPCGGAYDIGAYEFQTCGVGLTEALSMGKQFIVYPNPATNKLFIKADEKINEYMVYFIDGKKVLEGATTNNTAEVDISSLDAGIYLLQIQFRNKSTVQKFIKE